jgi:hypothetical protein
MLKDASRLPPHAEIDDPRPVARAASQIIALINSRPVSPRQDEIEVIIAKALIGEVAQRRSPLHEEIKRVANEYCKAFEIDDDPRVQECQAELSALKAQIPNPPRSFAHIVARAEIAYFGAEKERDDEQTMVLQDDDCFKGPAVRLVEAVLQFAGVYHG